MAYTANVILGATVTGRESHSDQTLLGPSRDRLLIEGPQVENWPSLRTATLDVFDPYADLIAVKLSRSLLNVVLAGSRSIR